MATRLAMAGWMRLATVRAWGWRPLVTVAILGAFLIAAGLAEGGTGSRVLRSVGLAAPSEPYTELYFASSSAPGTAKTAQAGSGERRAVSFVIHNAEQTAMTYEWTIRSSLPAADERGAVRIPRGGSVLVKGELDLACTGRDRAAAARPVRVQVSLAHPSESINYWTRCNA